jgi:hypothetical protein
MSKKYTLESLAYQVSTLSRSVDFHNYEEMYINLAQASMGAFVEIDIASLVSARAEHGVFQIIMTPNGNSYWLGELSFDGAGGTTTHLECRAWNINRGNSNMGECPLTADQTVFYKFSLLAGAGTLSAIIRLHGYVEPA